MRTTALSSSGTAATESSEIRGSHRASASRTFCSIRPRVFGLTGAKTCSHMAQPKSGRITRSPGAVVRIIRIAASISSAPLTSRTLPPGVSRTGKLHPDPIKSPVLTRPAHCGYPSRPADRPGGRRVAASPLPLVEPVRLAGELELGLGGDLDLRRLDDQLLAGLDLDG